MTIPAKFSCKHYILVISTFLVRFNLSVDNSYKTYETNKYDKYSALWAIYPENDIANLYFQNARKV